jgi:hypothetical protein
MPSPAYAFDLIELNGDDLREAPCQIIARPAVELHPLAFLAGDHPEAVVLDFIETRRVRIACASLTVSQRRGCAVRPALFRGGRPCAYLRERRRVACRP